MDRIVVDSSVFVKLISDEPDSAKAFELRAAFIAGQVEILVPSLFNYEVLNAAKYSKGYDQKELEELAGMIDDYEFLAFELSGNFSRQTAIVAIRLGITLYDASYVALAMMSEAILYTSDQPLIDAVKQDFVRHIRDYK